MGGTFFQSMTEWVFHQTPIFFTFNILLGVLASLIYLRKCERRVLKEKRWQLEQMAEMEENAWRAPTPAENY